MLVVVDSVHVVEGGLYGAVAVRDAILCDVDIRITQIIPDPVQQLAETPRHNL